MDILTSKKCIRDLHKPKSKSEFLALKEKHYLVEVFNNYKIGKFIKKCFAQTFALKTKDLVDILVYLHYN